MTRKLFAVSFAVMLLAVAAQAWDDDLYGDYTDPSFYDVDEPTPPPPPPPPTRFVPEPEPPPPPPPPSVPPPPPPPPKPEPSKPSKPEPVKPEPSKPSKPSKSSLPGPSLPGPADEPAPPSKPEPTKPSKPEPSKPEPSKSAKPEPAKPEPSKPAKAEPPPPSPPAPARKAAEPADLFGSSYDEPFTSETPAAPPPRRIETPAEPQEKFPVKTPNIEMVLVKGGKFSRGCSDGRGVSCQFDERPERVVSVSDFQISKYPVTQLQWKSVMGVNPAHFKGDDKPVEQVSWNDVQEFIRKLNSMTGKKYRLPTEAEWEYAAMGGSVGSKKDKYSPQQDKVSGNVAYSQNYYGSTFPVGTKEQNDAGIHDMFGNVQEWVSDWYGKNYYGEKSTSNPQGPKSGDERVYRGCSWNSERGLCRASRRNYAKPEHKTVFLGFRLAL